MKDMPINDARDGNEWRSWFHFTWWWHSLIFKRWQWMMQDDDNDWCKRQQCLMQEITINVARDENEWCKRYQ